MCLSSRNNCLLSVGGCRMALLDARNSNKEPTTLLQVRTLTRGGHPWWGYKGTECTSQRVGKNRRCQQTCLNRRRVCRFAGSVGFYPRAARYILCTPCILPLRCPPLTLNVKFIFCSKWITIACFGQLSRCMQDENLAFRCFIVRCSNKVS